MSHRCLTTISSHNRFSSRCCSFSRIKIDRQKTRVPQTMNMWIACRRLWLYLPSIFSDKLIQQKLRKEFAHLGEVDKSWNNTMTMTHKHQDFNNTMHKGIFLPRLKLANEKLEKITHTASLRTSKRSASGSCAQRTSHSDLER